MVGDRLRDQIFGGLVIGHDWHGYAIAQATEELGERKLFDIGKIENAAFAASHRMLSGDWGLRLSAACGGRLTRCFRELPAVGPDPARRLCAGHDPVCTAHHGIQTVAAALVRQTLRRDGAARWPRTVTGPLFP